MTIPIIPSMKKVAIIGTSNSILKGGWVEGLSEFYPVISNFSLGASPSLYAHYVLEKYNILQKYDILIIDFSLNDTFFIQYDTISPNFLLKSFESLLLVLSRQNKCMPVLLNFINKTMYREKIYSTYELYNKMASAYGIPHFPIGDLIARARLPVSHPNFFLDDWHISRPVSNYIGKMLGESIKNCELIWGRQKKYQSIENEIKFSLPNPEKIKAMNTKLSKKKTSLASYDAYDMAPESRLIVSEKKELCAIFVSQVPFASCCLSIVTDDEKYFCQKAATQMSSLTFSFKSLYGPLRSKTNFAFIYARKNAKLCDEDCNLRKKDTLASFSLIDVLFVENYRPDILFELFENSEKRKKILNLLDYIIEAQLRQYTQKILLALGEG